VTFARGWLRRRSIRIGLCVALGSVGGLLIFLSGQLPRPLLFGLGGAVAGLAAGVALSGRRSMRLTGVTVSVPQLSQLNFAVTHESQLVAWKLFVEMLTRVSTQPLTEGSGRVRSALTSLHGLLGFVRETLKESPPSRRTGHQPTVEQLALILVISDLRPFVTRWHQAFNEWQDLNPGAAESSWPLNKECRAELAAVQKCLREYVLSFGALAGVPNASDIVAGVLPSPADPFR
jgi:hypothetical protein